MIADGAGSPRSPGFGPVDRKTMPATAGLLSVGVSHTLNVITAQSVVDVRGAVRVGHPRLPSRFRGAPAPRRRWLKSLTCSGCGRIVSLVYSLVNSLSCMHFGWFVESQKEMQRWNHCFCTFWSRFSKVRTLS